MSETADSTLHDKLEELDDEEMVREMAFTIMRQQQKVDELADSLEQHYAIVNEHLKRLEAEDSG